MGKNVQLALNQFVATLAAPTVSNVGTGGSTAYGYGVVARVLYPDGTTQLTAVSATGSTSTGNATLSASNYNQATWAAAAIPAGASVTYDVYRISGGATQGKIGNTVGTSLNDVGLVGDGTTAPATNTTGIGAATAIDTTSLENYTFQLSGAGNAFIATVVIEGSQDGIEWATIAMLSNASKTGTAAAQTWAKLRAHMTAYTSGFSAPMTCWMAGLQR